MSGLASATSEGSLADVQDVGPTGVTDDSSPSTFWDAVLKPRGNGRSESGGGKKAAASNVLGWLAGLGGGGRSSGSTSSATSLSAANVSNHDRPAPPAPLDEVAPSRENGSSSRAGSSGDEMPPSPTGSREATLEGKMLQSSPRPSSSGGDFSDGGQHTAVPRLNSHERGPTGGPGGSGNLPDIVATPHTTSILSAQGHSPQISSQPPQHPVRAASSSSSVGSAVSGGATTEPRLSPILGGDSPSMASPGLTCMECQMAITGAVFMLHDQAYCCQRHRLVAYHKNEKGTQKAPVAPPLPTSPLTPQTTGLRASYATWM